MMVCSSNVNKDSRTCLLNQVIGLSKQFPTSGEGLIPSEPGKRKIIQGNL